MIVYDVATKVHAGLVSGTTFIVLFSQEKPLRWKQINTHTHIQTLTSTERYDRMTTLKSTESLIFA